MAPGIDSGSNRNEYQKIFLESKARPVRKADNSPASVSRLSRQNEILDVSQPHRTPRPVTIISLLNTFQFYHRIIVVSFRVFLQLHVITIQTPRNLSDLVLLRVSFVPTVMVTPGLKSEQQPASTSHPSPRKLQNNEPQFARKRANTR
jgi:hypothetical protein